MPLREIVSFRKSIGGTATNVAVACARLGHRSAVFTRVGSDAFGDYVVWALEETFGVDTRFVGRDPEMLTPLAFAELSDPAEPSIIFYRNPRRPTCASWPPRSTGPSWSRCPSCGSPRRASRPSPAARPSTSCSLARPPHPHHPRPRLAPPVLARPVGRNAVELDAVLGSVTMAIGNRAECDVAVGETDPDRAADACWPAAERGDREAGRRRGAGGHERRRAGAHRAASRRVVCGLGAGDAFGGALCHGLLSGWDLATCARAGNVAGAIVASRLMCADDMPYLKEIDDVLGR